MKDKASHYIAFLFKQAYLPLYVNWEKLPISEQQARWIQEWYEMTQTAFKKAYNDLKELYLQYPEFEYYVKNPEYDNDADYDCEYDAFIDMVRQKYPTQLEAFETLTDVLSMGDGVGNFDDVASGIVSEEMKKELKEVFIFRRRLNIHEYE